MVTFSYVMVNGNGVVKFLHITFNAKCPEF